MSQQPDYISLQDIASRTRYPVDAFHFVRHGLDFTVRRQHEHPEMLDEVERHVSGQLLCEGLRDFAIEHYGQLARLMLERWNIKRTEDFGHIVFAMVESELMQATEEDSIRDFENGFDFAEAFMTPVPVDNVESENVIADLKPNE